MSRQMRRAQRRREARDAPPRPRGVTRAQLIGASVVAVAAVVGFIVLGNAGQTTPSGSPLPSVAATGLVRGDANAPVTMEEWADFQCPACGQFARTTEPQLVSTYIASGKVKLVFHNMAFLGIESQWAAEAALCANEQGRFWEYHDKLYASQNGENRGAFSKDNLKKFGTSLGLGPSFATCVDSGRYAATVQSDVAAGTAKGVNATPTFFINGQMYTGALTIDQLKSILDPLVK